MGTYDIIRQGLYEIPVKIKNQQKHFTFFQDVLFGGSPVLSANEFIAMDYASLGVNLLEEAVRGTDATRVNYGTAFNEKLIYPKYFDILDTLNVKNAKNRVSMDEPVAEPWSVEKRLQYLANEKRDQMSANLSISKEKLCHDVLFTGKFETHGHGEQAYPMSSDLLAFNGANIMKNPHKVISDAVKAVIKYGYRPTTLVLNSEDATTLAESEVWQKMLDNRRVEGNAIVYKPVEANGVAYMGTISVLGGGQINIYSYLGTYKDASGVEQPLVPRGKALLVPDQVGCMGYAGLLVNKGTGFQEVEALDVSYDVWEKTEGPKVQTNIEMQSSPAPIITALDGYCVITGIPTTAN